jgi:hypothetical protein
MIAKLKVELKSGHQPTETQWKALKVLFPDHKDKPIPNYWFGEEITCDVEYALSYLIDTDLKASIEAISPHSMVVKIKDKYDQAVCETEQYVKGSIIQVHVPNLSLLPYSEVQHLDDSCTDELQKELDKGWRIIAVCSPNAQGCPDYILGRYSPEPRI